MNDTPTTPPTATPDADRGDDFYVQIAQRIQGIIDRARASRNHSQALRDTMDAIAESDRGR